VISLIALLAGCAGQVSRIEIPAGSSKLGPGPALSASLTLPTGSGPFPVVVLLHGCSGLQLDLARGTWSQLQDYAGWYAARGIAGLVVDSFASRGVRHVCTGGEPGPIARALDVYRALKHLRRLGVIDSDRAVVQGLSHGGSTVLAVMDERVAGLADVPLRLRGGIAYYPSCSGAMSRALYAPVLILIGDKDDWTPAPPCEGLRAYQEQRVPGRVRLVVYPGATHSFDFNSPRRYNEYGKLLAFDGSATRDAQRRVEAFLAEVLPRLTALSGPAAGGARAGRRPSPAPSTPPAR
jgi:dienelactone hydrolase